VSLSQYLHYNFKLTDCINVSLDNTGKTTTVVEAVYQLARQEDDLRILLVAPSNDAADVLVERLASYFPPSELRRILAYSRSVETVPTAIRTYVAENSSDEVKLQEILRARIVVSTVALAARFSWFGVPRGHFDVLCVDEAGHATEPEVVGAAAGLLDFVRRDGRVGQMILAGDHQQLGPIVTSDICRKFGLSVSFMERLTTQDVYARQNGMYPSDLLTKLVRNYRSHPAVIKLPNEMFYDNDLECCGDQMTTHSLANWEYLKNKGFPVLFHSMNGENLREGNSPSWFNPQEAQQVVQYVKLLMHETRPPLKSDEIGIITPYRRQAQKIRLALETQDIKDVKDIKVGSVESFQGQERRCIILSTVRAETEHISSDVRYNLGFVANEKRFNVAITRAKALLIVVGSPTVLATDKDNWLEFLLYCRDNKSWLGEEWDPEEAQEDSSELKGAVHEDEWELTEPGPSQAAEQEAFAFISREE
jgi:helicase MOV-10